MFVWKFKRYFLAWVAGRHSFTSNGAAFRGRTKASPGNWVPIPCTASEGTTHWPLQAAVISISAWKGDLRTSNNGWRLSFIIKRGKGNESLLPVAVTKAQVAFIICQFHWWFSSGWFLCVGKPIHVKILITCSSSLWSIRLEHRWLQCAIIFFKDSKLSF